MSRFTKFMIISLPIVVISVIIMPLVLKVVIISVSEYKMIAACIAATLSIIIIEMDN